MTTIVNTIDIAKLLGLVGEEGLKVEEQAAFHKIAGGDSGRVIYIAKTQKVTRVDLSGFEIKHPGIKQISSTEAKELKLGRVRGQVDFTRDEKTVVGAFKAALRMVKNGAEGRGARRSRARKPAVTLTGQPAAAQ